MIARLRLLPWWPLALLAALTALFSAACLMLGKIGPFGLLRHLNIAGEMNLAVWWASGLLTVGAVVSVQTALNRPRGQRWPWFALALVLAVLSWDEAGSLHERAFHFDTAAGALTAIPLAGVIGLLALLSVVFLLRDPTTRISGALFFVAFGLFASVPVQEWVEIHTTWAAWMKPIRMVIEEGSELLAATLMLAAVSFMQAPNRNSFSALLPTDATLAALRWPLIGGLLLSSAASILWMPRLTDLLMRGVPGLWYPQVVLLVVGLFLLARSQPTSVLVGVIALAMSAAIMAYTPNELRESADWSLKVGIVSYLIYEITSLMSRLQPQALLESRRFARR